MDRIFPGSSSDWKEQYPESYREWLSHVQTTLSDLAHVGVVEREDDRHAYLRLRYESGVEIPSWMASDGTLRLLALTLPAYLPASDEIYLLEEPENGIHPLAVDCVFQSLSSVYESQVLLATHSPVVLRMAELDEALCFAKDADGATDIVPGNLHPRLKGWRGSPNIDVLFATGAGEVVARDSEVAAGRRKVVRGASSLQQSPQHAGLERVREREVLDVCVNPQEKGCRVR